MSRNEAEQTCPMPSSTKRTSKRVSDILDNMSVQDKVAQMGQIDVNNVLFHGDDDHYYIYTEKAEYYFGELGIGSLLNTPTEEPWTAAKYRDAMVQINNITQTYNRPPVIWGLDSVHGANYVYAASLSPQPINIAATFNKTNSYLAGQLASRDTRAAGVQWLFSPLLGLSLEPRWSRVFETFGEDPVVVGVMAMEMIAGIQAIDPDETAVPRKAAACAKHFVGYSKPWNGHDRSPSWIPTRHLYQYFMLPWFKSMVPTDKKYIPLTVMESYTEYDGIPIVANHYALEYLLRYRLKFDGVLVTDYNEFRNIATWHKLVPDTLSSHAYALQHGTVDMSMIPNEVDEFMKGVIDNGIDKGKISMDRLDIAVSRILQLKEDLGMFEDVLAMKKDDPNIARVGTDDDVVNDMARESIVLAENTDNTLPLPTQSKDGGEGYKILVTGPTATSLVHQSGAWTWRWQNDNNENEEVWFDRGTNILEGILDKAKELDGSWDVSYSCGVDMDGKSCQDKAEAKGILEQMENWVSGQEDTSIERAVQHAKDKDYVIICIGDPSNTEKPGDVREMDLAAGQYDLVRAIKKGTSAKIVLLYIGGRTRLLHDMTDHVDAVLVAFLPGPTGGKPIADVLSGSYNPSGRMPVTYPKHNDNGGLPYFYSVSDRCCKDDNIYDYEPCKVQYAFGHGLSYTTFDYSNLVAKGGNDKDLDMSVKVTNSGNVAGAEVVLFFTFDESRITTPEYKRLRAFEKIYLEPGKSTTVKVTVPKEELMFVGPGDDSHYIYQPDLRFTVGVGSDTNCRTNPDSDRCFLVEPKVADKNYSGACSEACRLWEESDCLSSYSLSKSKCYDMCSKSHDTSPHYLSMTNEGWGWNYVKCLESVVMGFEQNGRDCSLMTSMCRNVLDTPTRNEFGLGSEGLSSSMQLSDGVAWATPLFSFVVGMIVALLVSYFSKQRKRAGSNDDDRNNIQFTAVRNSEIS